MTAAVVADWLVSRAARLMERKASRRGFIVGSAMVGSAVAVTGLDFMTKPGSALTFITDCGGGFCTDGYTEFCCALTGGVNTCPPNSFAGGWWRADSSSFCGGGTRYYIDCMQNCCGPNKNYCQDGYCFCEGCTACQCAGDCNTRRVYCNYFRYGQCHQEIGFSGPIACRVVTCTPPYAIAEYACSTAPAVDNATAEHAPNCAVNNDPRPSPPLKDPGIITRRKARTLIQVLLYDTINCFFVDDDGTLAQKVYTPGRPGADALGWSTYLLSSAGACKLGTDVEAQDGFQDNFHLFARAADGHKMVHLTWVRSQSQWVQHIV